MNPVDFFLKPATISQKQYEALRLYFVEGVPAKVVAEKFDYTHRGFSTIVTQFNKKIKSGNTEDLFFVEKKRGRKKSEHIESSNDIIIDMRKNNHSVDEIKAVMDSKGISISEKTIYNILRKEGFPRLPRRTKLEKADLKPPKIAAEKSIMLEFDEKEEIKSTAAGVLCLLPYIEEYGIREAIEQSGYPGTKQINTLSSILSFVALKASNVRRYTADNIWCMDRGQGMFAGLNVLPKAAWYTSYSDRVTSEMNRRFLLELNKIWVANGLISDTANLDFTTIPYWGDAEHLENNWSGKRGKALASMLAILAHDPDSGIIEYGDTNVMHKNESEVVIKFLDFYRKSSDKIDDLKYLVFDSKFTNYEKLNELNKKGISFVTIRRRGKNIVDRLDKLPGSAWKKIRIEASGNKKRTLNVLDETTQLKGYGGDIRQISIIGNGKIKPAIIITNEFDLSAELLVRKYAKRWLVEKSISEQISFFHLNNVSSSMVIKVDFDLTMSILTHNLFRLLERDLSRYEKISDQTLYEKFLLNSADISVGEKAITVKYKKKRNLPLLLETMQEFKDISYNWLGNKQLIIEGASYS
jgi:transposase